MSDRYAALYAAEAREQLAAATGAALALERGGADAAEHVDALFRAVHTLKGMSAAMGYGAVEALAHEAESVLARVRAGAVAATPALVDALLATVDALDAASERAVAGAVADAAADDVAPVLARLRAAATEGDAAPATGGPAAPPTAASRPDEAPDASDTGESRLRVRATIASDAPLPAVRAFMAVRNAQALGRVADVRPSLDALAAGECDGTVAFTLLTYFAPDAVASAVRAAGDVDHVEITDAAEGTRDAPAASAAVAPTRAAADGAGQRPPAPEARSSAVRVDLRRLDALVDLAGELSIARSALAAAVARVGDPGLTAALGDVTRLVAGLQEEALAVRMAPVGEAFDRMPRIVRDAARALGKSARLVVEGADVALDRAVLDHVAEPLVHLLRNAVAHGVESPADRVAAGKAPEGCVVLAATRDRDAVVVTVSDDGRGVDRDAVLRRARERGLVDAARGELSDDDLLHCIASPGLSTADEVTRVAGRGVGVDAVRARVRAVGGSLTLRTEPGRGTRFTLRLPVTLALTRALLLEDAGERYALPLTHVRETADLLPARVRTIRGREVFLLRGEVLPLVRLHRAVGADTGGDADGAPAGEVAVLEAGGRAAAVAVGRFLGQQDVVVKRLPAVRGALRIFGGATILEDGTPALILDAPALLHHTLS